jgi:glycosyltransferase involved in cell wall biosynthesis
MAYRVCFVTESFYPAMDGSATQIRVLGRELARRGHEVSIITRRLSEAHARRERLDGYAVIRVGPTGLAPINKYLMLPAMIRTIIRTRRNFDVIVVSDFKVLGPISVMISRLIGKRCLLRAASCGEMDGSYAYMYDERPRPLRRMIITLLVKPRNVVIRAADRFLSISSAITRELVDNYVDPNKIIEFGNGIDLQRFRPVTVDGKSELRRQLNLPSGHVYIYTGRLARGKGLQTLLEAWNVFARSQANVHLLLVGSCQGFSMDCEKELRDYVCAHKLVDSVHFTGEVHDVERYLQASDVFVFPTESEALGNAAIEAVACGLPCIGSNVGGVPDVIYHNVNGLLVPVGDVDAIIEGLIALHDQRDLLDRFSAESRRIALRNFNLDTKTSVLEELLATV